MLSLSSSLPTASELLPKSLVEQAGKTSKSNSSPATKDSKVSLEEIEAAHQFSISSWACSEGLVGRQRETKLLIEALGRRIGERRDDRSNQVNQPREHPLPVSLSNELILISGSPGTGKTALARTLQKHIGNGYFVRGKFDQLQRPEPYAPLVAALTSFLLLVLERGPEAVAIVRINIRETFMNDLGDIGILTHLIPALLDVVGHDLSATKIVNSKYRLSPSTTIQDPPSLQRLRIIFSKLVRACCSLHHPLVLVLDDLQWADSGSLDLLATIASDTCCRGLVPVAICRSNEIDFTHPLAALLRRLEDDQGVTVTSISVNPLTLEGTRALVTSVLKLPEKDTLDDVVSQIIHPKTGGNPLFILEFLKALVGSGVLRSIPVKEHVNGDEGQSIWDGRMWGIGPTCQYLRETSDVVDLLVHRLRQLPQACQLLLATAACLGGQIDEDLILESMIDMPVAEDHDMSPQLALDRCIAEGLVVVEECHHAGTVKRCRFYHDGIQQASYSFIPEPDRPRFHLGVGRRLLHAMSDLDLAIHIFLVVDQFVRGVEHISEEDEKRDLATLCLEAGKKAVLSSDFFTALSYLQQGDGFLDRRRKWVDDYQLTLDTHNTMIETFCCLAEFEAMNKLVDTVFLNARSFDDKLRAYMLRIYSLGSLLHLSEAIQLGLEVLDNLGERFPKRRGLPSLIAKFLNIQHKLRKKTDEDILNLPDCGDPTKLAIMGILNVLGTYSYIADQRLFPFLAMRMVSISLKYGLSAVSIVGFSSYGLLVCGVGDFDGGNRFGKLSMALLDRYEAVRGEWLPRCYLLQYGIIAQWTQPARSCFKFMEEAHRVGLERDIEFAWINKYLHGTHLFSVGEPLTLLEPFLRDSIEEMRNYKQDVWAELAVLNQEATLMLMGQESDPIVVHGALQDVDKSSPKLKQVQAVANMNFDLYVCEACVQSMMAHYHLGDLDRALSMAKGSQNAFAIIPAAQLGPYQAFYHGLIVMAILRKKKQSLSFTSKRKLLHQARKSLKLFQKLVKNCKENFLPRAALLEAEFAAWNGKLELAMKKYAEAESMACQERYLDIQGVACERAGLTLRQFGGNASDVEQHLGRAIAVYEQWGALAVVKRVQKLLAPDNE